MNLISGVIGRDLSPELFIDLVLTSLADAGIDEDEIDWIIWDYREVATYALVHCDMKVRAILSRIEGIGVYAPSVVLDKMNDSTNRWVYPRTRRRASAFDTARDRVMAWVAEDSRTEPSEERPVSTRKPSSARVSSKPIQIRRRPLDRSPIRNVEKDAPSRGGERPDYERSIPPEDSVETGDEPASPDTRDKVLKAMGFLHSV